MNTLDLIELFKEVGTSIQDYVNAIEINPIRVKNNLYLTGLRRSKLTNFQVHLKELNIITIKTDNLTNNIQEIKTQYDTVQEMWLDLDVVNEDNLKQMLKQFKTHTLEMQSFIVTEITFKLKNEKDNYANRQETIIFENKSTACKDIIAKRKQCTTFKSKFTQYAKNKYGQPIKQLKYNQDTQSTYTPTEEELANMPL